MGGGGTVVGALAVVMVGGGELACLDDPDNYTGA